MTFRNSARIRLLACAALAAMLAGCGGGGGSSDSGANSASSGGSNTSSSTPVASGPTNAAAIVTAVPAPTYAAGSGELAAFQRLNDQRALCGFGKLAQNTMVDSAAAAHLAYERQNNVYSHVETAGLPGFTGATVADRVTYAGYTTTLAAEVLAKGAPDATTAMQQMLDLPYHSVEALIGDHDVGLAWNSTGGYFAADFANQQQAPLQTTSDLRTYPCAGTQNVTAVLNGEIPNPFPAEAGATWGPTISVVGVQNVAVTSASITGPSGSVAIKAIYGNGQTTDPAGICTGTKTCVIPAPLAKGASYLVHIEGSQGSAAFVREFTFTTAS